MNETPAARFGAVYTLVAIQVFTVLLILAALEIGVRLFADPIQPIDINAGTLVTDPGQAPFFELHPFAAFSWIPNARFGMQQVNRDGFVSTRDIPMAKQDDEIRVITLGGSSTVGLGNIDEITYPRLLEEILQQKFPRRTVSVLNGAAGGYSTIESLGYLHSRLVHYRPDVLVIMHGWNDMYYFAKTAREVSEWRKNMNLEAMWNPDVPVANRDVMPADVQLLSWSQLYLHIRDRVRRSDWFPDDRQIAVEARYDNLSVDAEGNYKMSLKPVNEEMIALYESNLRQVAGLCDSRSMSCYSVLQPTLLSRQAGRESEKIRLAEDAGKLYHGFDFETHIGLFDRLYEINRAVFGDDRVIDATSMSGREDLFFDHIHMNPDGTSRLAGIVYQRLAQDPLFSR